MNTQIRDRTPLFLTAVFFLIDATCVVEKWILNTQKGMIPLRQDQG